MTAIPSGAPSYSNQAPTNAVTGGDNSFDLNTGYFAVGSGGDVNPKKNIGSYVVAGAIVLLALSMLRRR